MGEAKRPWEETWTAIDAPLDHKAIKFCEGHGVVLLPETWAMEPTIGDAAKALPARQKLAAAAPDLYRALDGVRVLIAATPHLGLCLVHEGQPCTCGMDSKRAAIEAALRKARGET